MNPIINSLLDQDLYKITMMNFALELFPDAHVEYRFKNRGKHRFTEELLYELRKQIRYLSELRLTYEEYEWMKRTIPYLTPGFMEYFRNFQFNPDDVITGLTDDGDLEIKVKGKWVDTIQYEVLLMAIISELYFKLIDINWDYEGQEEKAYEKIKKLSENACHFADFGTRRRRSGKNMI